MVENVTIEDHLYSVIKDQYEQVVDEAIRCFDRGIDHFDFNGIEVRIFHGDGGGDIFLRQKNGFIDYEHPIELPIDLGECINLYCCKMLDMESMEYGIIINYLVRTNLKKIYVSSSDTSSFAIDLSSGEVEG